MNNENQIIIFGAGEYGIQIKNKFFGNNKNVFFYDNDRRKWNNVIDQTLVIELKEFLEKVAVPQNTLIVGGKHNTMCQFLKDVKPLCGVFKIGDRGSLEEIELDKVSEFKYDNRCDIAKSSLQEHYKALESYKKRGDIKAYNHAKKYIEFKEHNLNLPNIMSLEFTNICNLQCPNCPNSIMSFPKGKMSDDVFFKAIELIPPYLDQAVFVHGFGEPLLHPKCLEYLKLLAEIKVNIGVSTNGILLTENMSQEILSVMSTVNSPTLYVSFHTKKSVENWYKCLNIYKQGKYDNVNFYGQILEHNKKQACEWLKEVGIENPMDHRHIRYITSHSWAGGVVEREKTYTDIEVANRIRNCHYLRKCRVIVNWDGSIKACCMDFNVLNRCGDIFNFSKIEVDQKGFELCSHCDPDWMSNYQ